MDISGINSATVNNTIDNAKANATDGNFEAELQKAYTTKDKQALRKVCDDFESIMLSMMYTQMKATVPKSDLMPDDSGKAIFDSMLDDQLMENASKTQSFGLSDMMYKQLSKQMDATYKSSSNLTVNADDTTSETNNKGDTGAVEEIK